MSRNDEPRLVRVAGRAAWHIRHAGRRLSAGSPDRAEAERALSLYKRGLGQQASAAAIGSLLELYLKDRAAAAIPGFARLRYSARQLGASLGAIPPESLAPADIRLYCRRRRAAGAADATVRTELQCLRAALRWAARERLLAAAPPIALPPRPPARDRWLTREEADRLLAACGSPHLRLFVALALHTAARAGAILALTWDRVDLDRRRIDLREPSRAKTRKGRAVVPVNDTLAGVLAEARARATIPAVIEYAGQPVGSVRDAFRRAAERAALPGVTPHTLRHTAATWLAQAGVPLWQIAGFLGHSSPRSVEETYAHHHPDHLAAAAKALG
ncbi:MAG: site-specific integrase [Rhodospirillales bacterium]|nr:site-specific integrase [Rhodospirillales bacterium]